MKYTRTIERNFEVGAAPVLRVANRDGRIRVRAEDREDIAFVGMLQVRANSEAAADEFFDEVELPISEGHGTVEIGPPEFEDGGGWWGGWRRRPTLEMELVVPRGCEVHASSRAGSIGVAGLRAAVEAQARAGAVRVRDIEGAVTLETRAGEIEVEEVKGDVSLRSRAGRVRLSQIDGAVRVGSRAGEVQYEGPISHEVEISVKAGSIRLGVTRDSSFFLDAESEMGSVHSELDVDVREEPEEGAPTVRLRTRVGSIRVAAV